MIYVNGDGIWLECNCLRANGGRKLLARHRLTMLEIKEIVRLHGHH